MLFKRKTAGHKTSDRKVTLKPLTEYRNIIVVIEKAEQIRHNQFHQLFPAADFSFLTLRSEKEDKSSGNNYTFHKSDQRFGHIKNERLEQLVKLQFDLIIDLSTDKRLKYFCDQIPALLKAGCFDTDANQHLDLLVKNTNSAEDTINSIARQINILTKN